MSTDKLRVGIIGIGSFALSSHVPNLRNSGRAEVVAISRRNAERLAMAKQAINVDEVYTDWRQMLDGAKLDAVIVSTPNDAHTEPTLAALERGLHVLVEKPITLTSQDAWAMIRAAEKAKRILMVGYDSRTRGRWRTAVQALKYGTIGRVRQVNAVYGADTRLFWDKNVPLNKAMQDIVASSGTNGIFLGDLAADGNWRSTPGHMGGGMFVDIASHVVDIMLWLAGAAPAEVIAFIETTGWPVENYVSVQARLDNGAFFTMAFGAGIAGGEVPFYGQGRLTVLGDKGMLSADWGFEPRDAEIWIEAEGVRHNVAAEVADTTPAAAFVASILDGAPNLVPPQEAAQVVALTQAVYRSAEQGRLVQVDRTRN